jgi:hypothetical protein
VVIFIGIHPVTPKTLDDRIRPKSLVPNDKVRQVSLPLR